MQHLLTRLDLKRTQTVFIEVIGIDLLDAEGRIAVSTPTPAQIEFRINASDTIMTREDQSQRIILAIAGIRELYLSEQRGKESAWSPEAIDAKRIIRSVLIGPLLMGNQSWRQSIQLEVAHPVGAYHHRCMLFIEGLNNLLEGLG